MQDGGLLYVGITSNPQSRFLSHQSDKEWFSEVVSATMEHFDSRKALASAEAGAVAREKPRYNRTKNGAAGRPEIGQPINVRLGDKLLALVDDYAASNGRTRADAIRFLLTTALLERHGSEPSGLTR